MVFRIRLLAWSYVFLANPVFAHHSAAAYDFTREISVEGTITDVAWRNPHIYLTVEVTSPGGGSVLQKIEMDGPAAVQTAGLRQDMLTRGAHVTVRGAPNRQGDERIMRGIDLATADRAIFPLGPGGRSAARPAPAAAATSIAGKWSPTSASFGALMRALGTASLTEAGQAARRDVAGTLQAAAGCAPPYTPPMLMGPHVLHTIEVSDEAVVIDVDGFDVRRVIRLNQPAGRRDVEPTLLGDSLGHWEGETLVVETTSFAPHRQGTGPGIPSGPNKRLVERLKLTEDHRALEYSFTLEDADYLVAPVAHTELWQYRPDLSPTQPCDAETARRFTEQE